MTDQEREEDKTELIIDSKIEQILRDRISSIFEEGNFVAVEAEVLRLEAIIIEMALESSSGSITWAAQLLGITHQGLDFILKHRQEQLLSKRKTAKSRRKSIIPPNKARELTESKKRKKQKDDT